MDKLSLVAVKRIWTRLFSLETDPRPQGSLKLSGTGGYRIRIGDYRSIDDRNISWTLHASPTAAKCTVRQTPS